MRRHHRLFSALLLLFCLAALIAPLTGCSPNAAYLQSKKEGKFPTSDDFPLTKWVCREKNLYFCMLDGREGEMYGEYSDGITFHTVTASTLYGSLVLAFSPKHNTEVSWPDDESENTFCKAPQEAVKTVSTLYSYENGRILCTVRNSEMEAFSENDTLTFDPAGRIAQTPEARWRCEETNMYLDSFSDADGYFSGEIILGEKRHSVQAFRRHGDNYYRFSLNVNGVTTIADAYPYALVNGYFIMKEDQIVCRLSEEHLLSPKSYPYWDYPYATLTFVREPFPQN